jgi:nitrogen fixation protein NifQ
MNARIPLGVQPAFIDESLDALIALALHCVIKASLSVGAKPLIRGLDNAAFARLRAYCLDDEALENGTALAEPFDEFEELSDLLREHAACADERIEWVVCAVSTAAQRDNHLWQDMGLPSRRELSALLFACFPTLAGRNTRDMKWKKFFYRELCQRAGVPICKSPNCEQCCDFQYCFGPEN